MAKIPPKTIRDVLNYYNEEVIPALAAAVIYDNTFPDAVLNEIRSALTHLGRANVLPRASDEQLDDLKAAYRHLKRVCLDCFKLSIVHLAIRIDKVMTALEEEFNLPEGVHAEVSALRKERIDLQINEGVKTPDADVIERYKVLFNQYDAFSAKLAKEYGSSVSVARREAKKEKKQREMTSARRQDILFGFLTGLASSIIVALVFAFFQHLWPFN